MLVHKHVDEQQDDDNLQAIENHDMFLRVRGRSKIQKRIAPITLHTIVQVALFVSVFSMMVQVKT